MHIQLKGKTEVRKLIEHLEKEGFKCHRVADDFIYSKVNYLISSANELGLNVDHGDIIRELQLNKIDSFKEIEAKLKGYFSRFGKEDKIKELIGNIRPVRKARLIVPPVHSDAYSHSRFNEQLKRHGLYEIPQKANGEQFDFIDIYVLKPGKSIKVALNGRKSILTSLIKLIYGTDTPISIKEYVNGNADLQGDLEQLRRWYVKYLISKGSYNVILT